MIISSNGPETHGGHSREDLAAEIFVEREASAAWSATCTGPGLEGASRMQCSFIDLGSSGRFLYVADVVDAMASSTAGFRRHEGAGKARAAKGSGASRKSKNWLKEGQEILVEVVKEPLGTKGARLTSHVTMAGRFLVFMPTVDHIGVSRKIESREEPRTGSGASCASSGSRAVHCRRHHSHRRLRTQQGRHPRGPGVVPKTCSTSARTWTRKRAPAVVTESESRRQVLRDLLTDEFQTIRIDNEQEYNRVSNWSGASCRPGAAGEAVHEAYPIF